MFFVSKDYGDGTYAVTDSKDNVSERYDLETIKQFLSQGVSIKGVGLKTDKVVVFPSFESYCKTCITKQALMSNTKFEFTSDFKEIRGYIGSATRIKIPDFVTTIGEGAFKGCFDLESVIIPDSVEFINNDAFWHCRNLKSVSLPNSLAYIGHRAFEECECLESIKIPDSVEFINTRAFMGCMSLKSISLPNSVTEIGESAFDGCSSLESVSLPESLETLGKCAFSHTGLHTVKIPSSVKEIKEGAFGCCVDLTSVEFSVAYANEEKTQLKGVRRIHPMAFTDSGLTSIKIPHTVNWVGFGAFAECRDLISVEFDLIDGFRHSITIEGNVFFKTGLSSIILPTTLKLDCQEKDYEVNTSCGAEMSDEDWQFLQTQFPEGCKISFKRFNG